MSGEDFVLEKVELNVHVKFIVKMVVITIISLFTIVGGCAMHSNTYDGERLLGEAEIQKAETEARKAEVKAEENVRIAEQNTAKERALVLERLIKIGVNPVAARCALLGWDTRDTTCMVATAASPRIN